MSLSKYKEKRNLKVSGEPVGGKPNDKKLHFVIQKHHASHLHYDFRLELKGVLKSWAVPKGLSMNPAERRLAMLVEDHPWDYRDFEGIIPSGYGAGTVMVWDEGTYEIADGGKMNKKEQEHLIMTNFWKGEIRFVLKGHKVKGGFIIKRAKEKEDNSWYLIKLKDEFATENDITLKDKSVLSKKTLEQIKADPSRKWESHKPSKGGDTAPEADDVLGNIKKGEKKKPDSKFEAMTCTLIKEPFNDPGWIYEVKLDGFRIIAHINKGKVTLCSRSGLNYTSKYPVIAKAFESFEKDAIVDGELVVLDEDNRPDFDRLQKYSPGDAIVFYAFDIVYYDGYDISNLDLITRKCILERVLPENELIKYSDHFEDGKLLFKKISEMKLEGIVAKRKDSTYQPGKRSKDWLKLPTAIRQEFVIGGWAESESGRLFKSLIFGAYEGDSLQYIGHAGGGFKEKEMAGILKKLKSIEVKKSPFKNKADSSTPIHYVKPVLVGNFKFATWTAQGKIRKPAIFLGFRGDKASEDVVREIPASVEEEHAIVNSFKSSRLPSKESKEVLESNWKIIDKEKITSEQSFTIGDHELSLTNVEKELWAGVTKADLITYYHSVAPYILPYLKDRTLSLHIKNIKPTAPGMYIKDMEGRQPKWSDVFSIQRKIKKKGKRNVIDYLVCNNEATLLYCVNLGCIDINPGTSTINNYLEPNYIVIDLDPSDDDFKKVIKTAIAAKKVFDQLKLRTFVKTSGKTGIHIFIPCSDFNFPEARTLAIQLATQIQSVAPDISTVENTVSQRGNKVFIDYNQNDEADTVAAPYSVRPAKRPTVSAPLEWKEVNEQLSIDQFDIHNIAERIKKKGDLFKGLFDAKIIKMNTKQLRNLL